MSDYEAQRICMKYKSGKDKNGQSFTILHTGEITSVVLLHTGRKAVIENKRLASHLEKQ